MIDGLLKLPIVVSGLAFAVSIEAYRRSTGGGRIHYMLASIFFAVVTSMPALGFLKPGNEAVTFVIGSLGAVYMIGGVLDHLELRQTLQAMEESDHVETV